MQRKYKDGSYSSQNCGKYFIGYYDSDSESNSGPEKVTLPPHTTTNKRVKAWEDLPLPLSDNASFTNASLQTFSCIYCFLLVLFLDIMNLLLLFQSVLLKKLGMKDFMKKFIKSLE